MTVVPVSRPTYDGLGYYALTCIAAIGGIVAYSSAVTVVALLRDLPEGLTRASLGEELLDQGSANAVWDQFIESTLVAIPGSEPDREATRIDVSQWRDRGWKVLTVLDPGYPDRVRAARRPPALLMADGTLTDDAFAVAIVGSRKASKRGLNFACRVARDLALLDVTVVSGLAEGIDTSAITSALEVGGRVVGVIGTGLDRAYPASNAGLQELVARRGLVLSEFLPGFRGARWAFPARNKTMSAFAQVTVIAEAGENSGTKHQAMEAVAHGRRLVLHQSVVTGTSWGRDLVNRPDVFVVDTADEAIDQLERIAAADDKLHEQLLTSAGSGW